MPRTKDTPRRPPKVQPFKRAVVEHGFSYQSMRDAHFRGELAVIHVGRAWYLDLDELARFAERHTKR